MLLSRSDCNQLQLNLAHLAPLRRGGDFTHIQDSKHYKLLFITDVRRYFYHGDGFPQTKYQVTKHFTLCVVPYNILDDFLLLVDRSLINQISSKQSPARVARQSKTKSAGRIQTDSPRQICRDELDRFHSVPWQHGLDVRQCRTIIKAFWLNVYCRRDSKL